MIYGLRVASNLSLPGLAICKERGPSDLLILLKESKKFASKFSGSLSHVFYTTPDTHGNAEPNLQVGTFEDGRYIGFFYEDGVRFAVERQGCEIWADWPDGYAIEDACTYLVGPVIAFALRLRGAVCLHASSIAVGGRAIALMGAPGAGKSTTAAAFARLGFPVLSDEVVVLADQGDQFLVQPGYPRVNLWPDSVRALFGSEDALPKITPTWGKRYLPLDQDGRRFQAAPLSLGAIYLLAGRESDLSAPVVEEIATGEAFMTLVSNTYVNYLLDAEMRRREFELLGRVMAGVTIRRVRPTNNPSTLFDLCEFIAADAGQIASRDQTIKVTKAG